MAAVRGAQEERVAASGRARGGGDQAIPGRADPHIRLELPRDVRHVVPRGARPRGGHRSRGRHPAWCGAAGGRGARGRNARALDNTLRRHRRLCGFRSHVLADGGGPARTGSGRNTHVPEGRGRSARHASRNGTIGEDAEHKVPNVEARFGPKSAPPEGPAPPTGSPPPLGSVPRPPLRRGTNPASCICERPNANPLTDVASAPQALPSRHDARTKKRPAQPTAGVCGLGDTCPRLTFRHTLRWGRADR